MISQMAVSDIEDFEAQGLKVPPADVVRLNALGLAVEHVGDAGDLSLLPRVAFLGHLRLREPSIAHGVWVDRAFAHVEERDAMTKTILFAFALSRPAENLPDADDATAINAAVQGFLETDLKPFIYRQVRAAVVYALYGTDAAVNEFPEMPEAEPGAADDVTGDALRSIYAAELLGAQALALGLSVRDLSRKTLSEIRKLRIMALQARGFYDLKANKNRATADYFRTLNAIKERLTKEKENGK